MNIVNEKSSDLIQELRIEIAKDDYNDKIEEALKKQRKKAVVPGFRPGNAPSGLIRKMYFKTLLAEEINSMVSEALYGYFRDNKLDILFEPLPVEEKTKVDFEQADDYIFTFEYALHPEFDLQLEQLPAVGSFQIKASEKEIEEYVNQLRKRHGNYTNPENIQFEDDFITLKYDNGEKTGYFHSGDLSEEDKELFKDKKLNDEFELSFRSIFKDDSALARFLKIEEKDINPDEAYQFSVKVESIGRVELAELNEDFFKKAFPDGKVTDKESMEKLAAGEIEKRWAEESDRHFMNEAIGNILNHSTIEMPDDFIKRYLLSTQREMTPEELEGKYEDLKKSFKWQLIENKLAKDYEIAVNEADIKEYIRNFFITNYFSQFNQEEVADRIDSLVADAMKNQEDVKRIYDTLFDKKIESVLRSRMPLDEKSGTFEEFITFVTGNKTEDTEKPEKKKTSKAKNPDETKPAKAAKKDPDAEAEPKKKPAAKKTTKKQE